MDARTKSLFRPMNVAVARGSRAERFFHGMAKIPEDLVPGLKPTPGHNLRFHGGKTIRDLTYTNFYVAGTTAWRASDIKHIDHALAAAMADEDLNNVMMQYFGDKPISTTFKPSHKLSGKKPASCSQGDVEAMIADLYAAGSLRNYDLASTVFNIMLPHGTVLTTDAATTHADNPAGMVRAAHRPVPIERDDSSLQGLGGYHGSVHLPDGKIAYYAVGVYSEMLSDGNENGIVAFDKAWKNVVATFYHELNEARTDPDVEDAIRAGNDPAAVKFLGWVSKQGEECGDYPMFEVGTKLDLVMQEVELTAGSEKVPVQFQYSNAVDGPEGPIAQPH